MIVVMQRCVDCRALKSQNLKILENEGKVYGRGSDFYMVTRRYKKIHFDG